MRGIKLTRTQNKICSLLYLRGSLTRHQICFRTHIPRTTVYDNLFNLQKLGIVKKYSNHLEERKVGRPKIYWKLNEERVKVIDNT